MSPRRSLRRLRLRLVASHPAVCGVSWRAAGVWQQVCSQAAAAQGPDAVLPSVDGVTQMGLSHPVVATLIQVGGFFLGAGGCPPCGCVTCVTLHTLACTLAVCRS
jgi:hypothetical protein